MENSWNLEDKNIGTPSYNHKSSIVKRLAETYKLNLKEERKSLRERQSLNQRHSIFDVRNRKSIWEGNASQ